MRSQYTPPFACSSDCCTFLTAACARAQVLHDKRISVKEHPLVPEREDSAHGSGGQLFSLQQKIRQAKAQRLVKMQLKQNIGMLQSTSGSVRSHPIASLT